MKFGLLDGGKHAEYSGFDFIEISETFVTQGAFCFVADQFHRIYLVFVTRTFLNLNVIFYCRWVRPDLAPLSGMAILQLAIPTGFVVSRDHIEALYAQKVRALKRVRFRDNTLFTFWENVSINTLFFSQFVF